MIRPRICPTPLDRDWGWLSVHYGFGDNASVPLNDIYRAKKEKKRFLAVADGWVDVMAVDLDAVTGQPGSPVLGRSGRRLGPSETFPHGSVCSASRPPRISR